MNRQEKLIVGVLVAVLLGWMFLQSEDAKRRAEYVRAAATNEVVAAAPRALSPEAATSLEAAKPTAVDAGSSIAAVPVPETEPASTVPETTAVLSNDVCRVVLTSKGGGVRAVTMLAYPRVLDSAPGDDVELGFAGVPALSLEGVPGFGPKSDFTLTVAADARSATLRAERADGLRLERSLFLTNGYRVAVTDRFVNASGAVLEIGENRVALGAMRSDMDVDDAALAVDARLNTARKPEYPEFSKVNGLALLFGGAGGGGCSAASVPAGAPMKVDTAQVGEIGWVAARTRFFVQVLTPGRVGTEFRVRATRETLATGAFRLETVGALVGFAPFALAPDAQLERTFDYYAGPRKMTSLRELGAGQARVMRFGMWRIFCEWLLDILNALHSVVPNYGVAIIVLTCLVRLVMYPVTKRSTESMKRMAALQPKLKEVQALHKGDPQKIQRETMRLYSEHKVNPLSSCLPMLIQLPVFVALFTVLQSAVELRFAPFLWVVDLSSPENLFKETLGFGINILPVLMSGTMALQSYLTPMAGDASQQRMMMIMMPIMMLVMFYTFPAALGLYWTTSQTLAIFGLLRQRRKNAAAGTATPGMEVIPPPKETRQMRRSKDR